MALAGQHIKSLCGLAFALAPLVWATPVKDRRDVSYPISRYLALGDSFTCAPNADIVMPDGFSGDYDCQRTTGSWAWKLAADAQVEVQPNPGHFQINACTGDTARKVIDDQINAATAAWVPDADLYTITAGGNDIGFADIVSACVYNYASYNCDMYLNEADLAINHDTSNKYPGFHGDLDELYQTVKDKSTKANKKIVVLPYATFYNTETEVNHSQGCYTSKDRRARMNQLTGDLNILIKNRTEAAGIDFLDPGAVEQKFNGHRFCEPPNSGEGFFIDSIFAGLPERCQNSDDPTAEGCYTEAQADAIVRGGTPFHPTGHGNDQYKDAIKAMLIGHS